MKISTIVEREHLTTIEWRGKIVVSKSPRQAEFLDYLDNDFAFPTAVGPDDGTSTSDFDTVTREVRNDFELALVAVKMAAELELEIIVTEEL